MDATQSVLGYIYLKRHPAPRTQHGWTYDAVGAIFAEPPFNILTGRRSKFPGGDYLLAELHPWTQRKVWVIDPREYESLDGLGLPVFEDEPTPVDLDRETHE